MPTSTLPPAALTQLREQRLVDLSHTLHDAVPGFPGKNVKAFERTQGATLATAGVNTGRFAMSEHLGTHLDAPIHFVETEVTVDRIPPDHLVAEAVVIDVTEAASADAGHRLTPDEITAWEAVHGPVPDRSYVLVRSGWADRWDEPERYLNADTDGRLFHPAIEPDAARVLVDRGVLGVGVDTLSVDNAHVGDEKGASHKVLHGAGRYVLENLARLAELPATGITLVIGALPIADGTAGPARVLAFVAESDQAET